VSESGSVSVQTSIMYFTAVISFPVTALTPSRRSARADLDSSGRALPARTRA
jgi:hypothetical protein